MSHISKIELQVKDLGVLKMACERLGMTFCSGQREFKWYGKPAQCDHAIRVPNASYDVGVVKINGHFELRCDYFDQGLVKAVGPSGGLLKQAYAVEKTRSEARRKGYSVIEKQTKTGVRLHVRIQ